MQVWWYLPHADILTIKTVYLYRLTDSYRQYIYHQDVSSETTVLSIGTGRSDWNNTGVCPRCESLDWHLDKFSVDCLLIAITEQKQNSGLGTSLANSAGRDCVKRGSHQTNMVAISPRGTRDLGSGGCWWIMSTIGCGVSDGWRLVTCLLVDVSTWLER